MLSTNDVCAIIWTKHPQAQQVKGCTAPPLQSLLSKSGLILDTIQEPPTASGALLGSNPYWFFNLLTSSTYRFSASEALVFASTSFCQALCLALP
jgi:hypothetical protein